MKMIFVLAVLLLSASALAQDVKIGPSRARLLTAGDGAWTSNGTVVTTTLDVQIAGGFKILAVSPNIIRSAGSPYLNMNEATGGGSIEIVTGSGGGQRIRLVSDVVMVNTPITYADFTDDSATTGNRTVNASRGFNAFAAAATAITITNSNVTTSSQIYATIMTNDATAVLKNCVPAAGSFTCNLNAAATGITKIAWTVGK